MGSNFPGGKTKRGERDDVVSLRSRDGFHGDGGKINMEWWGLYIVSDTQLHKGDIIEPLQNICNHITAC